jgi:hypothetical protein
MPSASARGVALEQIRRSCGAFGVAPALRLARRHELLLAGGGLPRHGSRFSVDAEVRKGPAVSGLAPGRKRRSSAPVK